MSWLLWREFRLNSLILAAGVCFLLIPYVVALVSAMIADHYYHDPFSPQMLADTLLTAGIFSMCVSCLTIAMLAGNALAGETADRSAEYVAYLPIRRWRLLASKLILCVITVVVLWGFNAIVAAIQWGPAEFVQKLINSISLRWAVEILATSSILVFSASWLFSSLQPSPVFASVMGFITLTLISGFTYAITVNWVKKLPAPVSIEEVVHPFLLWFVMLGLPVAILCFSIGTWNYLRQRDI